MRISDWSSDVCSSDLIRPRPRQVRRRGPRRSGHAADPQTPGREQHMSSKGIVGELVVITSRMVDVMSREAELLKQGRILGVARSEEHTSELQSLMRI